MRSDGTGCSMGAYSVDILAVGFFVLEWAVYAVTLEHTAYGRDSLSARMHVYREIWIRRMLDREARMVDMQIMASLQNGTAFFASTSLLAVGGGLALLRSTNDALAVFGKLPIDLSPVAGAVGDQMRRADPDLHLRVLQIRLVLPAVQLCRHPARRDAAGAAARHAGGGSACDPHHTAVRNRRDGISIAASARSSSRSAISAGSSAPGCCSSRRRRS